MTYVVPLLLLVLAPAGSLTDANDNRIALACPKGTRPVAMSLDATVLTREYAAQYEQFCVKRGKRAVREGPYVQIGPNGERLLEGHFMDGEKHGTWIRRNPSQTIETDWQHGIRGTVRIRGTEDFNGIDVHACIPHEFSFPLPLGSVRYTVTRSTTVTCDITVTGEIEMAERRPRVCHFPRRLRRIGYHLKALGIDFGEAEKYCDFVGDPP